MSRAKELIGLCSSPVVEADRSQVTNEIIRQIGNVAFKMMGAKNLVVGTDESGNHYLNFKIGRNSKGVSGIKITYNRGLDLYDILFYRVRGMDVKVLKEVPGIYADHLHSTIEHNTGLYLSL